MYVYRLRSIKDPTQTYIGLTRNITKRIEAHNNGQSTYTNKFRPWKIETFTWFAEEEKARAFEKYLKSGSGRAFSQRHY